jgi:hypothetical protein
MYEQEIAIKLSAPKIGELADIDSTANYLYSRAGESHIQAEFKITQK